MGKKLDAVREWFGEKPPLSTPSGELESSTVTAARPDSPASVAAPDEPRHTAPSIAPIVVGEPSPTVEPRPTSERFRTHPYRPDTVVDGWSIEHATVRAASLRGHVHRFDGAPRQDDMAVHALPSGRIVIAVADGVSSALHAHVGSTVAVRQVAQWITAHAPEIGDDIDWDVLVSDAAWALAAQAKVLLGLDKPDLSETEKQFATTLVVAVIDPAHDGALTAQIASVGDSGAWVLRGDGTFESALGGKHADSSGLTSSAVSGLPRRPAEVPFRVVTVSGGETLLIGTDGVGDPLGAGVGGVGDLFRSVLTGGVPALVEFAHALDFSRATFDDDRTLVAVWPARETA